MKRILLLIAIVVFSVIVVAGAEVALPCRGTATTVLNVRTGPGTDYRKVGRLEKGEQVYVAYYENEKWVKVLYDEDKSGYVHASYLTFSPLPSESPPKEKKDGFSWFKINGFWDLVGIVISLLLWIPLLYLLVKLLIVGYYVASVVFTFVFRLVSLPLFWLNALQRYLAKPWMPFFKKNRFSDSRNSNLLFIFYFLKFPFYVALFPLRLVNAVVFNLAIHCSFEMFNYVMEVLAPTRYGEGADGFWEWVIMLPTRVVKYLLWHGSLTVVESVIWTAVDAFLPALTVFHGTDSDAADKIVASRERGRHRYGDIGLWVVGGGDFAGKGIYFAPRRSTAVHYSRGGSLIVCRVTFGSTLDLGLAPFFVYWACGKPRADCATRWGLENGYVTGEWWRSDTGWWEYCMYDWQNRYNYSWRIRPLYVINLSTGNIQRIPGGMCHWLFRRLVVEDIFSSIDKVMS